MEARKCTSPGWPIVSALLLSIGCGSDPSSPDVLSTGAVIISTRTHGQPSTGDGYAYRLNNGSPQPIGFNTTTELPGVPVGSHLVRLTNLPQECTVLGPNPVEVGVTYDVPGNAAFEVSCAQGSG